MSRKTALEAWRKANPERYREIGRIGMTKYTQRLRSAILEIFNNECVRCKFSDKRALQIDHINGEGLKDRRKDKGTGAQYYLRVLKSIVAKEEKFQILCANCNWIKQSERREVSIKYKIQ